jgi:Xaa-Pro aminopeptidase
VKIAERLQNLRQLMQQAGADFCYVPSGDAHQNEYVPKHLQRRAWISNFTGSAGDALIGLQQAYLWTDPRYFLQADNELDSEHYQLMKEQVQGFAPPIDQWLKKNAVGKTCAVDPKVITIAQAKKFQASLEKVNGKLVATSSNLIDHIWEREAPVKKHSLRVYDKKYSGMAACDKIKLLRNAIKQIGADAHVITMLDAIAWLYDIRGEDVDYNPLVISYAIITQDEAILLIDQEKIRPEDFAYFKEQGISLRDYDDLAQILNQMKSKVLLDPATASLWVEQQLSSAEVILEASPITLLKACKNLVEQEGAKEAHRRDAKAVIRFLSWLDQHWQQGHTELSLANKLEEFRKEDPSFISLSFNTISGFAAHGAIVHYAVSEETNAKVDDSALYLLDSGGQYLYGTTDITRVIHLGKPTEQEKHHYTLVLKGHLALGHTVFVEGTRGEHLDAIARAPLWQEALNYGHGTGHGVGAFLCVHEGPQRISAGASGVPLRAGMIVSNEPGLYISGQYGLRIENLCLIKEVFSQKDSLSGHGPFYGFEDLTLVPYNRKLINKADLTLQEVEWINAYHANILATIGPMLMGKDLEWLKQATQAI